MAIVFDPINHRIILDTSSVTATEIYSRSVDWSASSDNLKYGPVFRQVGGDDLGGGLYIPPYFFLQGLWRVRPMESNHVLTITGNLFVEGGGVPVVQTLGAFTVSTQYTVPVQAQAFAADGSGGGSLTNTDIENIATRAAEKVWASAGPYTTGSIGDRIWRKLLTFTGFLANKDK